MARVLEPETVAAAVEHGAYACRGRDRLFGIQAAGLITCAQVVLADRVVVMFRGQMVETGRTAEILQNPQHPYSRALIDCVPKIGGKKRRLASIDHAVLSAALLGGTVPAWANAPANNAAATPAPAATAATGSAAGSCSAASHGCASAPATPKPVRAWSCSICCTNTTGQAMC